MHSPHLDYTTYELSNGIQAVLQAVLARYRVLYPDWELSVISLEKDRDKTAQLNRIIATLESMKQV